MKETKRLRTKIVHRNRVVITNSGLMLVPDMLMEVYESPQMEHKSGRQMRNLRRKEKCK